MHEQNAEWIAHLYDQVGVVAESPLNLREAASLGGADAVVVVVPGHHAPAALLRDRLQRQALVFDGLSVSADAQVVRGALLFRHVLTPLLVAGVKPQAGRIAENRGKPEGPISAGFLLGSSEPHPPGHGAAAPALQRSGR